MAGRGRAARPGRVGRRRPPPHSCRFPYRLLAWWRDRAVPRLAPSRSHRPLTPDPAEVEARVAVSSKARTWARIESARGRGPGRSGNGEIVPTGAIQPSSPLHRRSPRYRIVTVFRSPSLQQTTIP